MDFGKESYFTVLFPVLRRAAVGIAVSALFTGLFFIPVLSKTNETQLGKDLLIQAELIAGQIIPIVNEREYLKINTMLINAAEISNAGITLITPEKRVFFQRESDELAPENLIIRDEIQKAAAHGQGTSSRYSDTFKTNIVYAAVRFRSDKLDGYSILRLSAPVKNNFILLVSPYIPVFFFCSVVLIGLFLLIIRGSVRKIVRPIERLNFVTGTLFSDIKQKKMGTKRAALFMFPEIDHTIHVLYAASSRIRQYEELLQHREFWETSILAGMTEGVLAVNTDFQILVMNDALKNMFRITREQVLGERVEKVFAGMSIIVFIEEIFLKKTLIDRTLTILENHDRYLQVIGTPLIDESRSQYGALLVIRDITTLRRLETVRKDFASNVSHELKTPLTSIKGYVETLLDDPSLDKEDSERFLAIIKKQTDRVIAIVEDLLQLSQIEKEVERDSLSFETVLLWSIINEAVELCGRNSGQKKVTIKVDCPADITVYAHPHLLGQAIINLIDNAIKYSDPSSVVNVSVQRKSGEICINVEDYGCGIPQEHFPRLFERFYRVDKSRSRNLGGTGLGLAIVKHIIQAHRGRFKVSSTVGSGSTFSLCLPDPNKN